MRRLPHWRRVEPAADGGRGAGAAVHSLLPAQEAVQLSLDENGLRMLDRAGEAFCAVQLERGFRTLDYYKAFLVEEE